MAVVQRGDSFMLLKSERMGKVNTTLRKYFWGGVVSWAVMSNHLLLAGADWIEPLVVLAAERSARPALFVCSMKLAGNRLHGSFPLHS